MARTLQNAKSDTRRQILVFQHIAYFLKNADEKDQYFNIPLPACRKYLNMLESAGVRYVYHGHYHRNATPNDGSLTETVSSAVGMPLGGSLSGFRIVTAHGETLDSTWFCFGGIANQIDLQKPLSTSCPQ